MSGSEIFVPKRVPQRISWHSFDLKSGRRGIPVVTRTMGTVGRILGEATEASIDVRVWDNGAPLDGWEAATQPARVMLVAIDEETQDPVWGGMVYRRVSNAEAWVTLSMVTLEAYLDRRYVNNDYAFTNADQISAIAATIVQDTTVHGDGVVFVVDAPVSNWLRDRTYTVDEDKTILSVLTELADVKNGIEFTVDLAWVDATQTTLARILRFRNRVGTAYTGAFGSTSDTPTAVFHMPGSVVAFEYIEDYSADHGANAILAVSSGEGDTRPRSSEHLLPEVTGPAGTWPLFEYRFTPSTSITESSTLDAHAAAMLAQMHDGMNELTLEANLDAAPRVGFEWFLGDDVAVSLTSTRFPERTDSDNGRVPGYQGNVRCIGYEIDYDARRLKPRLMEIRPVDVEAL